MYNTLTRRYELSETPGNLKEKKSQINKNMFKSQQKFTFLGL